MSERVFDENVKLKDNAMLKHSPELFNEWDFKKNDELGLDIYRITQGSGKIAWWSCPKCESLYDMEVFNRGKLNKRNCPYCAGVRVNHTNSLSTLYPHLAKEWHPTKNGNKTPHDVPCRSGQKVWWLGTECGHPWEAVICSRTNLNSGCSICSGHKLLIGYNDMWTTNPELASMLANPEDGYRYMQSSGSERLNWKCSECGETIKNQTPHKINKRGFLCPICSDGIPFPEKFMYNLLKEANIDFEFDTTQEWSGRKRYDFYLTEYNWIIETHGGQHYDGEGFSRIDGARNPKEEQENDRSKEKLAKENKIDNYIVIDSRYSTVEWMKNSILNSEAMEIMPEIDFIRIGQLASNTFVKIASDMWNSGLVSTQAIANKMKITQETVIKYLKRGAEIGWCDYDARGVRRSVIQLSIEQEYLREWESIAVAERVLNITRSGIGSACNGKRKSAGGFKWMYKEDYDNMTQVS